MPRRSMRAEIATAALDRFHAHGYAVGVKDITDAAGVPKGSFYNHFPSKEAMAVEALAAYGATLGLEELADESVAPLDRLRAHFELLAGQAREREFARGCLFGNLTADVADHSPLIRGHLEQGFDDWAALITGAIAQAQRDGVVAAGLDAATTARFVLNAWEGALLGARAARSEESFAAFFTTVFDVLLRQPN
ncbi:TetR family transcriptional regulator C-terminal domain-containing protein [Actinoplanes sp. HUAS TT8]|uniref:TetR/AcrR family transcriptional regulator n=1 Tax=Actinoplanes sp. HUAS TT8 TaxID=3447453 RepID=UPI003F522930